MRSNSSDKKEVLTELYKAFNQLNQLMNEVQKDDYDFDEHVSEVKKIIDHLNNSSKCDFD